MRSHQSRQRRKQRSSRGQEDDQILVSRTDDSHSDSYTHPRLPSNSHPSENYRTPTPSRTGSYEMAREPSSSRINHEHPESWHLDSVEDRYSATYRDSYHRRVSRDGYEMVDSREEWRPRRSSESHHPQQRDEWPSRYHGSGQDSYSYQDPTGWDPPPAPSYDDRLSYSRWPEETVVPRNDNHDFHYRQRDQRGGRRERDASRDKHAEERPSDMGWVPRHRENGRRSLGEGKVWDRPRSPIPERSWEPAESWKSSQRNDSTDTYSSSQRNNGYNKQHKGSHRKSQQQNKSRREWRNDDSHLNNWHRRDNHTSERPMRSSRKKHPRSFSHSRSRSPAESYYSHYSSKGRSRSRSPSPAPKRARREPSPLVRHQETPLDNLGRRNDTSYNEKRSVSPSSRHTRGTLKARRKSISSISTVSTDRSRSRSPDTRPRAVHRLPTASTGQYRSNTAKEHKTRKHHGRNHKSPLVATPSSEQMPPPSVPHRSLYDDAQIPVPSPVTSATPLPATSEPLSYAVEDRHATPARMAPIKHAGFKPIGQNSTSSLKRFFPGDDDDDMDVSNDSSSSSRIHDGRPEDVLGREVKRDQDFEHRNSFEMHQPPQDPYAIHSDGGLYDAKLGHQHLSPLRDADAPLRNNSDDEQGAPPSTRDASMHVPVPVSASTALPTSTQGEVYSIVSQVGEGTFGKVYKARNTYSGVHVALKRIRMETEKDGFPVTAMREIKLLQSLRHDNVVRLHEMMVSSGSVYMVFEYMDHDLTGVLSQTQFIFSDAHLKSLCHQMLAGLGYLHHKGVIHRDIKGSNILINNRGELKLGDFGLARFYQKRRRADYTNRVITLWYRPPELLFGATIYGPEVDMWSAGCIMLELFTKKPVFQGNDEISQLDVIYRIIGTPNRERWADVANLPWYELVKPKDAIPNHFRELFRKWMSPAALDLAERLLDYNPAQRITASQALDTPYFSTEMPPPSPPVGLATLEGEWHELETKRERAKRRRKD
ncbi:hypothetical protein E1B28_004327 [Marasmius oreades]|uniref:[RNA-polymerase]-subunit kinase n=1 Tax=Marasmius oreades TaxID=181124 RepID=A0A9P8ACK4_9AGAR|nr:uncharacterized protein E1B28_004327 [Marasmius oreades]KAG7096926.1 hypothetical protein E1B28_004327 [Marasmius oreades]